MLAIGQSGNIPQRIRGSALNSTTFVADSGDQVVALSRLKTFRKLYVRNKNIVKAGSLITVGAFEMDVVMAMVPIRAGVITQGIARSSVVVQYLMDKTIFQERFQCSVNRHPIIFAIHGKLNITMRHCNIFFEKNRNNIASALGEPKGMSLQ